MSLLIERIPPGPPPPPPPPGVYTKDTIAFNRYVDSIYKLDVKIGVINELSDYTDNSYKRDIEDSLYQELIDQYHSSKTSTCCIEIGKINVKRNRELKVFTVDSARIHIKSVENIINPKVKCIVNFSDVTLNEGNDKAIIYMGRYSHPLNGSTSLILLEKLDGKWKIYKRITLSIS
ncbi:hypothetical protein [Aquimarina sediminis]|uniref:hypothetical protein n=1 Tax=Aquimarina sediminis TaxID=2070536 RepID=UPI000FFEC25A|nr:hypothetical protein [Aquimarina sediminis]